MGYLKVENTISGTEGSIIATIDGEVKELAECSTITLHIDKNKAQFKTIGYRGTQSKTTGWSGTGSMTISYVTSRWAKMLIDYAKTGKDTYFSLLITNDDATAEALGAQRVRATGCNIDGADVAKLSANDEFLSTDISFTFNDIDLLDEFNDVI